MRTLLTTLLTTTGLAFSAGPASATVCQTQPGQGAIDQYCEIIPSGAGVRPDRTAGGGAAVSRDVTRVLRAAGSDGAEVEALARTSPAPSSAARRDERSPGSPPPRPDSGRPSTVLAADRAGASRGTLGAVFGDLASSPGGSSWLPWALAAVAIAALCGAWRRRGQWS